MFKGIVDAAKLAIKAGDTAIKMVAVHGSDITEWFSDRLPDAATLNALLGQLKQSYTAIPVRAECRHHDDGNPDDYVLHLNIDEIASALNEGRVAIPQITVYAKNPEALNRDLLAERLEEALKPLLAHYTEQVNRKKAAIVAKRKKASQLSFWEDLDLTISIAFFPPIVLLLAALDFLAFISQLPALIKAKFTGDELDRLDAELNMARATVKKIVRRMKIEPLI